MTVVGFDHVQILGPPGCEPEARRFFGGVLGFAELPQPGELAARGGVWFACGEQQLHVSVDESFRPSTRAAPAFRVADFPTLGTRLDAAGVPQREAHDVPDLERFFVDDPWGNRIEFTEDRR